MPWPAAARRWSSSPVVVTPMGASAETPATHERHVDEDGAGLKVASTAIVLPMPSEPLEPHIRDEVPADDATLVVRGGSLEDPGSLTEQLLDMARRFTYRDLSVHAFSVEAVTAEWPLLRVLADGRSRNRHPVAVISAGELRRHGWEVVPTFGGGRKPGPPHHSVVVPDASNGTVSAILAVLQTHQHHDTP